MRKLFYCYIVFKKLSLYTCIWLWFIGSTYRGIAVVRGVYVLGVPTPGKYIASPVAWCLFLVPYCVCCSGAWPWRPLMTSCWASSPVPGRASSRRTWAPRCGSPVDGTTYRTCCDCRTPLISDVSFTGMPRCSSSTGCMTMRISMHTGKYYINFIVFSIITTASTTIYMYSYIYILQHNYYSVLYIV